VKTGKFKIPGIM